MKLSLIHFLLAAQFAFFVAVAHRAGLFQRERAAVGQYLTWLGVWSLGALGLATTGWLARDELLPTLPGLWLSLGTLVAALAPVLASQALRAGLMRMVDATPWHFLALFQALRISALGTAYKTWIGEFPYSFELLVGVPDLAFGLSALFVAAAARRGTLSKGVFAIWNLIGLLIIVPSAPLVIQLGLPGPLQLFTGEPDARAVLDYPMVVAPLLVVPFFVLINSLVAWRVWECRNAGCGEGLDPTAA